MLIKESKLRKIIRDEITQVVRESMMNFDTWNMMDKEPEGCKECGGTGDAHCVHCRGLTGALRSDCEFCSGSGYVACETCERKALSHDGVDDDPDEYDE